MYDGDPAEPVNAKTYAGAAAFTSSDANYSDASGSGSLVINNADATCTVSGYTGDYDAASHGGSGSCSGVNGEQAGTLDLGASFKDVPGGTANWVFTGNGNYKDQGGSVGIVISAIAADCPTISGSTVVYDGAFHGASGACTGLDGESAGTLDRGATIKDVPSGTAHWVFTGARLEEGLRQDVSPAATYRLRRYSCAPP